MMMTHTHSHTRHVNPRFIQEGYHMTTLCNCTFETRVEGIAGEESENVGLTGKSRIGAVVVHERLEAGGTTDGLS